MKIYFIFNFGSKFFPMLFFKMQYLHWGLLYLLNLFEGVNRFYRESFDKLVDERNEII